VRCGYCFVPLGSALGSSAGTYPTSCSATNQWATTCRSGRSKDVACVWRVPATGTYHFDTIMEIRNYKATSEVLECNDGSSTDVTSITLNGLIRGTQLLIIIEGYQGACGNVQLNITRRKT
jgi:hypothetical protein